MFELLLGGALVTKLRGLHAMKDMQSSLYLSGRAHAVLMEVMVGILTSLEAGLQMIFDGLPGEMLSVQVEHSRMDQ